MKPAILDNLTFDQQEQLITWMQDLTVREVLEKVAAPAPEGFGIKTHATSLRRFYNRHLAQQMETTAEEATILANHSKDGTHSLESATASALREKAFRLATDPRISPTHFREVASWVLRLETIKQRSEEIEIEKQRLVLEREKFQYSAARAALNHYVELGEILRNSKTDNEDKIFAARDLLFGISRNNGGADGCDANRQPTEPSQPSAGQTNR